MPFPTLRSWCRDAGLVFSPRLYRDAPFLLALLAGVAVGLGLYLFVKPHTGPMAPVSMAAGLMFVLAWPLAEEIVFRGVLQGELQRTAWGARGWHGITMANVVTSLVFVAFHFINHPPLWAASVIAPSLVFGYLRDRHASVWPAFLVHAFYNLVYLVALS
jgi:membrane protease YdiL (CAAX protease family)